MKDPFGITIFCDDIRHEAFNKISLMGAYGYELVLFGKFPTVLPKLGMLVNLRFHKTLKIDGVKFLMYFPGDPEDSPTHVQQVDLKLSGDSFPMLDPQEYPDPSDFYGINHPFLFSPAVIKQPGYIRVRAIVGQHRIRAGSLKLREALPEETPQEGKQNI